MSEEMAQAQETTEGSTVEATGDEVQQETLYANKYKSVSALEEGYTNLQGKLGAFTGSPEEYTPNEGTEIDSDNPMFDRLKELGTKHNMNNDVFNELIEMYNGSVTEQQAQYDAQLQEEFAKLGDNKDARIQNVIDWGKANLSEAENAILDANSTSADMVVLVEKFISMSKPQGMAQDHQVQTRPTYDADKLHEMRYAKDAQGNRKMSTDPEYYKKVTDLEAKFA